MYKISIIIPVYNAENTIGRCLDSIINQSIGFESLEVILINDCSTDNSKKIIEEYSSKYPNIRLINLETNHGRPGYGRNIGINESSAKYLMFMDNDDEYDSNICEKLYETLIKENCDIVGCNHIIFNETTKYKRKSGVKYTNDEITTIIFPETIYYYDIYVWNKIFKKDIILKNNISFITEGFSEDELFCIEYFINSKNMVHINNYYGYKHYDHGNNLSSVSLEYNLGLIIAYYEVLNLLKKSKIEINYNKLFCTNITASIERSILMNESKFNCIKKFLTEINKFEKTINFENKYIENPFIRKINYLILKNRITLSTLIIKFIKFFSKNSYLKNIYRKIFH